MHTCNICNYFTLSNYDFKRHLQTKKHINNTSYQITNPITNQLNQTTEIQLIKKEYEIERLKNELYKKDLENKNLQLQMQINSHNNNNNSNNTTINNIKNIKKVSKIEFLNINFSDVIDINTYTENYKNDYGLDAHQCEVLLSNYNNGGINNCITTLVHYLKLSAIKQYKELKGKIISIENIILPFVLLDKCLRSHFEKSKLGYWWTTTLLENIRKLISITNDHIYKHHKVHMLLSDAQKKKLENGILKESSYTKLNDVAHLNLYNSMTIATVSNENDNTINKIDIIDTQNGVSKKKTILDILNSDEDEQEEYEYEYEQEDEEDEREEDDEDGEDE